MEIRTHRLAILNSKSALPCKVCSENVISEFSIEQSYVVLVFMPLFSTKRNIYKICPKCDTRLKINPNDSDFKWADRSIAKGFNLSYYWGTIVLAGLILLLWYWYKSVMEIK